MAKTFLQYFSRYEPGSRYRDILNSATDVRIQVDKQNRMIQASVDFPRLVSKVDLYQIEYEIKEVYDLNLVKIMPRYPSEQ